MRTLAPLSFFTAALLIMTVGRASACFSAPEPFIPDPAAAAHDRVPPGAVGPVTVAVRRADDDSALSTRDLAWVNLSFAPSVDDGSAPDELGYRAEVIEGERPPGMARTVGPVRAPSGALSFIWLDVPEPMQRESRLLIRLWAIDRAGNESAPIDVEVHVPGGPKGAGLWVGLIVAGVLTTLGLVIGWRRRTIVVASRLTMSQGRPRPPR